MPKSQPQPLPKISIIIPFYNSTAFLAETLDSVLAQTYQNLEIVLIDDGSTDSSPKIAKDYAAKDPRILYHHQVNLGVSSARNRGLSLATGAFLSFVDSDDTLDPTLIDYLHTSLIKHSADLASTTFKKHASLTATLDSEAALKQLFLEQNTTMHLWAKLYRRELWQGLTFPTGHIYEDVALMPEVFSRATRIFISSKHLYNYRRRPGSYVTTPSPSQFSDLLHFSTQNLKLMQKTHPTVAPYAEKYIFTATRRTLQDLLRHQKLTPATKKHYLTILKSHAPATLRLKATPNSEKLLALLACMNKTLPLPFLHHQARKPQTDTYD